MKGNESIPGYTYGTAAAGKSPMTSEDLTLLKSAVLFGDEDLRYLRLSGEVLAEQTDAVLDVWYGFVGSHPHLAYFFGRADNGVLIEDYLTRVRARFKQWILDTAHADYDQTWLNYQHEIGLRHHRSKKNVTDNAPSVANINYRYIPAFIYPITATLKPFLAKKGHAADEVEKMQQAWQKSVILQVILWSHPYIKDGDF